MSIALFTPSLEFQLAAIGHVLQRELRADVDHGAISRILYHQQTQESLLLRVAEKVGVDASDIASTLLALTQRSKKGNQM